MGRDLWELRELAKHEHFDAPLLWRALQAFRPYRWQALGIALLLLLTSALGVLPPLLTRTIIDQGILRDRPEVVITLSGATILVAIVSGLLDVWENWLSNLVGQNVMADFRLRMFAHLQRQSLQFFAGSRAGELVSRLTNDVSAIQSVVTSTLVGVTRNLFVLITTLAVMFSQSWPLTLLSLLVVPAFVTPTQRTGQVRRDLQAKIQGTLARLTAQLAETLGVSGILLIQAFTREKEEMARFAAANRELRDLLVRQSLVGRWLFMWLNTFSVVGPALLWGYGGWLVIHHALSVGTVVAFVALLGRLYGPLSQLAQLHVNVLTSVALFRRIFHLLDHEPEIRDGPQVLVLRGGPPALAFVHVSYTYPGAGDSRPHALVDVNLEVPPGRLVALVGPSGAGKTTLLHMVPRFHDPTEGQVLLNGQDVRSFTLASLRSHIGLVPQEPFLLHDTILNNLLYARPDATMAEIVAACRAAQIHDVICAMPEGYHTVVGERGYRLSGGEKQRLAIARVLLRAPSIVLLDEATSSLDTLAERRIQSALATLLSDRTALVIAHRLSTIMAADLIAVMQAGRIVALGRHKELLAQGGLYARLYEEQFAVRGCPAEEPGVAPA